MKRIKLILIFTVFGIVFSCNNHQRQIKVEKNNEESTNNQEGFPQEEVTEILTLSNGKRIYVRAKIWGVSSNHEEIVFSETPITIPDKDKDYIFYTNEVFYKINGDTLNIYACDCDTSEPKVFFDNSKIILNDLKTSSQIRDYSANYKNYGLEKMSIYEE
ncbi:hypothetical protein [Algoriphagus sp. Y33]|uniref:hypothetical protein n=1 Tax=Algoriphagus sp. Y33 TaxID=2772483 RepID=UPI00177D7499|nr:hypothetical protein [Algoriphagus sp. Y33]